MVDRHILDETITAMPVFPLSGVVLMPGARLPLHVFEPRYRALVEHVLAHHHLMGIVTVHPGEEGMNPPVFQELGVGRVIFHQTLPDGRSNIVLEYVAAATVEEELTSEYPFRLFRCTLLEEDASGVHAAVVRLRPLLLQLGTFSERAVEVVERLMGLGDEELIDELARNLISDPDDRRAYLGHARKIERVALVEDVVAGLIAEAGRPIGEA